MTLGRPTNYTPELIAEICDEIASSGVGITRLCKRNPHWPAPANIFKWLRKYAEFREQYALAKEFQMEVLIDEIIDIADNDEKDYYINDDGKLVVNAEHINRARLRIDTRKWKASKLAPKKYGDRTIIESGSGETLLEKHVKEKSKLTP